MLSCQLDAKPAELSCTSAQSCRRTRAHSPCGGRVGVAPTSLRYGPSRVAHVSDDSTLDQAADDAAAGADTEGVAETDAADTVIDDAEQAIEDVRKRLAEVPAEVVVTNHVMGLYELAAIHLSAKPPNLTAASLAIDAVGILVDGLGDRLGTDAPTLRDALSNIRMAYVSIKSAAHGTPGEAPDGSGDDAAVTDDDALGAQ